MLCYNVLGKGFERSKLMPIGTRIKRIRTLRGITQKELGVRLGYSERNADIRIAQYESGKRTPKEDVINGIASILEVSPEALKIPDIESYHGFIFTLFELEEQFGLTIDMTEGMPNLHLDKNPTNYDHNIKEMLDDWYKYKSKLASGEISIEEYINWKLNYSEKSDLLLNSKPSEK